MYYIQSLLFLKYTPETKLLLLYSCQCGIILKDNIGSGYEKFYNRYDGYSDYDHIYGV